MKNNPFSFILDNLDVNLPPILKPFRKEIANLFEKIIRDKAEHFDFVSRADLQEQKEKIAFAQARIEQLEEQINKLLNK